MRFISRLRERAVRRLLRGVGRSSYTDAWVGALVGFVVGRRLGGVPWLEACRRAFPKASDLPPGGSQKSRSSSDALEANGGPLNARKPSPFDFREISEHHSVGPARIVTPLRRRSKWRQGCRN